MYKGGKTIIVKCDDSPSSTSYGNNRKQLIYVSIMISLYVPILWHNHALCFLGHSSWERSCLYLCNEVSEVYVKLFELADGAVVLQKLLRKGARLLGCLLAQQLLGQAYSIV